ncbi:hypothetical protein DRP77_11475, partial [Candidatus Poribacteria bacterium]
IKGRMIGVSDRPLKTVLLQNYPNPLNSGTWIPFILSESSEVRIEIFDILGRRVREVDLGLLKAGAYIGRDEAAFWDGRNDSGEEMPSGVYFYRLKAGEFEATRRLVILK